MFERETVFILGAGASWHYGYPTGDQLIKQAVQKAENILTSRNHALGKAPYRLPVFNYINGKNIYQDLNDFVRRIQFNNPPVIDYFLREHPSLRDIGKTLITQIILESQQRYLKHRGSSRGHNYNQTKANKNDDWIRYIIYKLTSNINKSEEILKNKVSFITFNYDTSIDNLLRESLDKIELTDKSDVSNFFAEGRIIHIYGKTEIGSYEPNEDLDYLTSTDLYGLSASWNFCFPLRENISTVAGSKICPDDDLCLTVRHKIRNADDIFILGYGFDQMNNELLDLSKSLRASNNSSKRIFFTNYGDKQIINQRASNLFFGTPAGFFSGSQLYIHEKSFSYFKSFNDVYSALEDDFDFL